VIYNQLVVGVIIPFIKVEGHNWAITVGNGGMEEREREIYI